MSESGSHDRVAHAQAGRNTQQASRKKRTLHGSDLGPCELQLCRLFFNSSAAICNAGARVVKHALGIGDLVDELCPARIRRWQLMELSPELPQRCAGRGLGILRALQGCLKSRGFTAQTCFLGSELGI